MTIARRPHPNYCPRTPFQSILARNASRDSSRLRWSTKDLSSVAPCSLALVLQNHLHHIHIVQLPTTRIHSLQQLIHLIIAHLLSQIRQDVSELPNSNETRQILVEDLETSAVFLWFAWVAEAAGSVEDAREGVEVD